MAEQGYNGWTNYETWNLNLWIENEECSYNHWRERAAEVYRETDKGEDRKMDACNALAEELKNDTQENAPEVGNGFYGDILTAAISEVNWYEIAKSWVSDISVDIDKQEAEEAAEAD